MAFEGLNANRRFVWIIRSGQLFCIVYWKLHLWIWKVCVNTVGFPSKPAERFSYSSKLKTYAGRGYSSTTPHHQTQQIDNNIALEKMGDLDSSYSTLWTSFMNKDDHCEQLWLNENLTSNKKFVSLISEHRTVCSMYCSNCGHSVGLSTIYCSFNCESHTIWYIVSEPKKVKKIGTTCLWGFEYRFVGISVVLLK